MSTSDMVSNRVFVLDVVMKRACLSDIDHVQAGTSFQTRDVEVEVQLLAEAVCVVRTDNTELTTLPCMAHTCLTWQDIVLIHNLIVFM